MSVAIAVTPNHEVAGHFGKAASFVVFDDQGQQIAELVNQGRKAVGCKHKKQLQAQLAAHNVKTILLGNVGQRSLARLLGAGFEVFRVPIGHRFKMSLSGKPPVSHCYQRIRDGLANERKGLVVVAAAARKP